ncbi:HDOD domain-containing protein [Desulfosarcina ovata]|uniref:HDIG domain protein n=1 Tax=Desulfosarcina ovata subsp. ovata TaxID=2752305 RepID=A0A5K8A8L2_9BACT|nr:HDOD domain-containing protein [Desulfosarcina ovata]BBO88390.1 HDIG domain protein [Desulfosarcina ovata subsp. ovata]
MTTIPSIIEELDQLRPVSDVAGKVLSLLDDSGCGMSDLADIIRHEPALTANLLKLANSAYFGLPGKIGDAKQAIVYLGMTQVVDLILLVSCADTFKGSHSGYGLDRGALWESAICAAILANALSEKKGFKSTGLTFTGALLRDIGKVVIDQHVKSAMPQIMERVETQHISFMAAERQVLGVDHAQVGAMVAKRWHFPPLLQCIIRYYHTPLQADGCFTEASIVHLADAICRKMKISPGVDDSSYEEDERIAHSLGLNETVINGVIGEFSEKMEHVRTLFLAG